MGYDDYECLFCHINDEGNVENGNSEVPVCLACLAKEFEGKSLGPRHLAAIAALFFGKCFICKRGKHSTIDYYAYDTGLAVCCKVNLCQLCRAKTSS